MSHVNYHEDLVIPGTSPLFASSLKQILHKPKSRIYPLFLPQRQHLRTMRVEYFGFLFDFAIKAFLAIKLYNW